MRLLLLTLLLCTTSAGFAQQEAAPESLSGQIGELLRKSYDYRDKGRVYEVVRRQELDQFVTNVNDSIGRYTGEIAELRSTITQLEEKIATLSQDLATRQTNIAALTEEKDSISLLGLPLSKTTYSLILWSAIIGLGALLLLALGRTRVAVASSSELRAHNEKVIAELEDSRKQRLTVEQKLRRQLQDEINKNRHNS